MLWSDLFKKNELRIQKECKQIGELRTKPNYTNFAFFDAELQMFCSTCNMWHSYLNNPPQISFFKYRYF